MPRGGWGGRLQDPRLLAAGDTTTVKVATLDLDWLGNLSPAWLEEETPFREIDPADPAGLWEPIFPLRGTGRRPGGCILFISVRTARGCGLRLR